MAAAFASAVSVSMSAVAPASLSAERSGMATFSGLRKCAPASSIAVLGSRATAKNAHVCQAAVKAEKWTKITPLGDRVFVKTEEVEAKTAGGLLLPTTSSTKPNQGKVVSLGERKLPNGKTLDFDVKEGDTVIFSKFAGTPIEFGNADHVLLKEDDITGKLPAGGDVAQMSPLGDRVLIKVDVAEAMTSGGVLLTEEGNRSGVSLKVGQKVLYARYSGSDFKGNDGTQYVVIKAGDILAALS
eukprot:jgi/Mesvir1/29153/Mv18444-RA.1